MSSKNNSGNTSGSGFWGFLGRNWWKFLIGIIIAITLISTLSTWGSALAQAFKSLLGLGNAAANAAKQQLSNCGIGTQTASSCSSGKDCVTSCGRTCTCDPKTGYCMMCKTDSDCPKGFSCDENSKCAGGLFAPGCYVGLGILFAGLTWVITTLGAAFIGSRGRSKLGEQAEAEGVKNGGLDDIDQAQLENDARENATKAAEDGKIPESEVENTTVKSMTKVGNINCAAKTKAAIEDAGATGAKSKEAVQKGVQEVDDNLANEQAAEREQAENDGPGAEEANAEAENFEDGFINDAMALALYSTHIRLAQTHSDARRRVTHSKLAVRRAKRLQKMGYKLPTLDDMALVSPPGKKMYVSNAGIPIMPITTTCGGAFAGSGIDYANLSGVNCSDRIKFHLEEVTCPARCNSQGGPCCNSNTVYDMCWRSPDFGTAVGCKS